MRLRGREGERGTDRDGVRQRRLLCAGKAQRGRRTPSRRTPSRSRKQLSEDAAGKRRGGNRHPLYEEGGAAGRFSPPPLEWRLVWLPPSCGSALLVTVDTACVTRWKGRATLLYSKPVRRRRRSLPGGPCALLHPLIRPWNRSSRAVCVCVCVCVSLIHVCKLCGASYRTCK